MCAVRQRVSQDIKRTWWWNDEVAALVQEKKRLFRLWKGPKKAGARKGVGVELASVG